MPDAVLQKVSNRAIVQMGETTMQGSCMGLILGWVASLGEALGASRYAVLRSATQCYAVLRSATQCYAVLCSRTQCSALVRLCYAVLRFATQCYAVLRSARRCYAVLRRATH